jgi:hypothetical protein
MPSFVRRQETAPELRRIRRAISTSVAVPSKASSCGAQNRISGWPGGCHFFCQNAAIFSFHAWECGRRAASSTAAIVYEAMAAGLIVFH